MLVAKLPASTISAIRLGLWKQNVTGQFCLLSRGLLHNSLRGTRTAYKWRPMRRTNLPGTVLFNKGLCHSCAVIRNSCRAGGLHHGLLIIVRHCRLTLRVAPAEGRAPRPPQKRPRLARAGGRAARPRRSQRPRPRERPPPPVPVHVVAVCSVPRRGQ